MSNNKYHFEDNGEAETNPYSKRNGVKAEGGGKKEKKPKKEDLVKAFNKAVKQIHSLKAEIKAVLTEFNRFGTAIQALDDDEVDEPEPEVPEDDEQEILPHEVIAEEAPAPAPPNVYEAMVQESKINNNRMSKHWLLHTGDGVNFANSSKKNIWGVNSQHRNVKGFLRCVKKGDKLWFVNSKNRGLLVSVATFDRAQKRTATNDELGWTKDGKWDTEILFENQYDIRALKKLSDIIGQVTVRLYNEKCKVNLPAEYENIVRYSQVLHR